MTVLDVNEAPILRGFVDSSKRAPSTSALSARTLLSVLWPALCG